MMAVLKGYRAILVLPARMSPDKDLILRAFGAEVVRSPDSTIFNVAQRLVETIPHAIMLNQFENPNNPLAHELTTAPEIIAAIESTAGGDRPSSGKVDVFVAGSGSGGTLTGVARGIRRDHNPDVKIIASDPTGSIHAEPESLNDPSVPIRLEGMGIKFIPQNLDRSCITKWIKITDDEAFDTTLLVHRHEALLVGGSAGGIVAGALKYLKSEEGWNEIGGVEGKNVILLMPDGIRNYMTQGWFVNSFSNAADSPFAAHIADAIEAAQTAQSNQAALLPIDIEEEVRAATVEDNLAVTTGVANIVLSAEAI